jgi:hypothetical protein
MRSTGTITMSQQRISGRKYVGTFAESDGVNFFFYDNQNRVLVGKVRDLDSQPAPGGKFEFMAS